MDNNALGAFGAPLLAYEAGVSAREEQQRRRKETQYRQKIMDDHLAKMGMRQEAGIDQLEMDKLRMELDQTTAQLAKQATYQAFDNFTMDNNPEHINRLIAKNPRVAEAMPDVLRVDQLGFDSKTDQELFRRQTGYSLDELASVSDIEKAKKRFVKITTKAGEQKIVDMQEIFAGTGYLNYKDERTRARLVEDLKLEKDMAEIEAKYATADKTRRMGTEEWVYPPKSTGAQGGTAFERNAEAVGKARERVASGEATEADMALLEMHDEITAGNIPGKQSRVDQTETNLFKEFGGEDQFYGTQFTPGTEQYRKAERSVRKIEALSGVQLTSKQVETMGNIRKTIAAGRSAQGLTNADMGLVDNTLKKLGAYVSDDAMGAEARSAWAGIRNQLLHAFAGSAMNEGELERWGEQFGNLYQQGGHVLTTLANALNQLGGELDSLRLALPEASFHVRLGADVNQLNSVIDNIGRAAATLSKKAGSPVAPVSPAYPPNANKDVPLPTKSNAELLREMLKQRKAQQQGAQ